MSSHSMIDAVALALMAEHGRYALDRIRAVRAAALTETERDICDRVERGIVKRQADRYGRGR